MQTILKIRNNIVWYNTLQWKSSYIHLSKNELKWHHHLLSICWKWGTMTSLLIVKITFISIYKLQDGHLATDHSFCYVGYSSQRSYLKKHVQHLQLPPARAKPTLKVYKPWQMGCTYLFPQVLHKYLNALLT